MHRAGLAAGRLGEDRSQPIFSTWPWVKTQFVPLSAPSEHPNPTTKIGSKMGGEFTYPKMGSQNGFEPWPCLFGPLASLCWRAWLFPWLVGWQANTVLCLFFRVPVFSFISMLGCPRFEPQIPACFAQEPHPETQTRPRETEGFSSSGRVSNPLAF